MFVFNRKTKPFVLCCTELITLYQGSEWLSCSYSVVFRG